MSSKQKIEQIEHRVIHPVAEVAGAWALAAVSLLVAFEAIIEHHPKLTVHHQNGHDQPSISEIFARGETKGETARLPEEFDIGLQSPHVSGL